MAPASASCEPVEAQRKLWTRWPSRNPALYRLSALVCLTVACQLSTCVRVPVVASSQALLPAPLASGSPPWESPARSLGLHQEAVCSVVPEVGLISGLQLLTGHRGKKTGHFDVMQRPNGSQDPLAFWWPFELHGTHSHGPGALSCLSCSRLGQLGCRQMPLRLVSLTSMPCSLL